MDNETHSHSTESVHQSQDHVDSHAPAAGIANIIYIIGSLVALLLLVRFVFIFFGAASVGVASFIYQITNPLVAPFYGIFQSEAVFGTSRIELESLLAIIGVALITYLIVALLRAFR